MKPVNFHWLEIIALLENRKTQFRRPVKIPGFNPTQKELDSKWFNELLPRCPYGQVGTRLYVKEQWAAIWPGDSSVPLKKCLIEYQADKPGDKYPGDWPDDEGKENPEAPKWRNASSMPKWVSRFVLEVKQVRVMRLDDMFPFDALKEGIKEVEPGMYQYYSVKGAKTPAPLLSFQTFWYKTRGAIWKDSLLVWVIDFERVK
jgi:hypothetical protein